jgi:hypothetical protein
VTRQIRDPDRSTHRHRPSGRAAREARQLYQLGCDMAQGYHFHRPQTSEYVDVLLAEQDHEPLRTLGRGGEPALNVGHG